MQVLSACAPPTCSSCIQPWLDAEPPPSPAPSCPSCTTLGGLQATRKPCTHPPPPTPLAHPGRQAIPKPCTHLPQLRHPPLQLLLLRLFLAQGAGQLLHLRLQPPVLRLQPRSELLGAPTDGSQLLSRSPFEGNQSSQLLNRSPFDDSQLSLQALQLHPGQERRRGGCGRAPWVNQVPAPTWGLGRGAWASGQPQQRVHPRMRSAGCIQVRGQQSERHWPRRYTTAALHAVTHSRRCTGRP